MDSVDVRMASFSTNANEYVVNLCGSCRKECDFKCSSCNVISYCSVKCQKSNWQQHHRLMKCRLKKKRAEEENGISPDVERDEASQTNTLTIDMKNRIKYGDMVYAQTLMTCTFLIEDFCNYGTDRETEAYLEMRSKEFQKNGFPFETNFICEDLLDKPLFKSYEGAVYYHNSCFGVINDVFDDHLPRQNPIKLSDGPTTRLLTGRILIQKLSNGVSVDEDHDFPQYSTADQKPLFLCSDHKDLSDISLYQFKDGVLILVSCY